MVAALVAGLATAGSAAGAPGLLVGVTEDGLKLEPDATRRDARALGLDAVRITLKWRPGRTRPTGEQRGELDRATRGAGGLRIVLSVYGERAVHAPTTPRRRRDFCQFVSRVLVRYRSIRDVVVWNEPTPLTCV